NGTLCDGAWHQVTISVDPFGTLRLFTDGQLNDTVANIAEFFRDISYCSIGEEKKPAHAAIDELRLIKRAILTEKEILNDIAVVARDTISDALFLFHFEDFGKIAHSSISAITQIKGTERAITEPIYFSLDSEA